MTVLFGVASAVRLGTADWSGLAFSVFILLCVFAAALILQRGATRTFAQFAILAQFKVPCVRGTVRRSLAVSISHFAVGIALAPYGVLNLVLAAWFVLARGLAVAGNSMRLEAAIQSQARQ
jgi:hypothetical protein